MVVAFTAFTVAVAVAIAIALAPAVNNRFDDLQAYQLGASAVRHHLSGHPDLDNATLYTVISAHDAPFTYPPFAALVMIPLSLLTLTAAGLVMTGLTVASLLAVLALTVQSRLHGLAAVAVALGSAAVFMNLQPISNNIGFGQVGMILAAFVAADLLLPRTPWPRGCLIGLAAAIKLTPGLFIVALWVNGQRRAALTAAATAVTVSALAAVILPTESVTYWTSALWQTGRVGATDGPRNRSLWGLVLDSPLPHPTATIVLVLLLSAVTILGLRRAAHLNRTGHPAASMTVIGSLTCALSPITWSHHLVWLIPAAALLLLTTGWKSRLLLAAVLAAATGLAPLADLGIRPAAAQAVVVVLVIALLTGPADRNPHPDRSSGPDTEPTVRMKPCHSDRSLRCVEPH